MSKRLGCTSSFKVHEQHLGILCTLDLPTAMISFSKYMRQTSAMCRISIVALTAPAWSYVSTSSMIFEVSPPTSSHSGATTCPTIGAEMGSFVKCFVSL